MSSRTEYVLADCVELAGLGARALGRLCRALGRSVTGAAKVSARELAGLTADVRAEVATLAAMDALERLAGELTSEPAGALELVDLNLETSEGRLKVRHSAGGQTEIRVNDGRLVAHTTGIPGPECLEAQDEAVEAVRVRKTRLGRSHTSECQSRTRAPARARPRQGGR